MGEPNGPTNDKELASRAALITPSVSPPPPPVIGTPASKPPTKRRRLASTPSSSVTLHDPSPSVPDPAADLHERRKASAMRLLSTWEQLGERYYRPLDQDDIIDLRDNTLFRDRGVLRRLTRQYKVGYFMNEGVPLEANDASSDGGGAQTDEDTDDFDALGVEANLSNELELELEKLNMLPAHEKNPADEEDLREFLEAERKRKELYGDDADGDDDEHSVVDIRTWARMQRGSSRPRDRSEVRQTPSNASRPRSMSQGFVASENEKDVFDPIMLDTSSSPLVISDDSDDEFAAWDFDTSPSKSSAKPFPNPSKSTPAPFYTTQDIIDLTDSPPSSPPPRPSTIRDRSQSVGPARARSRAPRGRSVSRARSKTPSHTKSSMPPPPAPQPPSSVRSLQLFTPPLSSSSVVESTPEIVQNSMRTSPAPSPPPPPRPKPRPRFQSTANEAGPSTQSLSTQPLPPIVPLSATNPSTPKDTTTPVREVLPTKSQGFKWIMEVVIPTRSARTPSRRLSVRPASPPTASRSRPNNDHKPRQEADLFDSPPPAPRPIGRKAKQTASSGGHNEVTPHVRGRSPERGRAASKVPQAQSPPQPDDPPDPPSPRGWKRKRVVSSSSVPGSPPSSERSSSLDIPLRWLETQQPVAGPSHGPHEITHRKAPSVGIEFRDMERSVATPSHVPHESARRRAPSMRNELRDVEQPVADPSHSSSHATMRSKTPSQGLEHASEEAERVLHSSSPAPRAHTPHTHPSDPHPFPFMLPLPLDIPVTPQDQARASVPPMAFDPQVQYQAAQLLSYLMRTVAVMPPAQGFPPPYPVMNGSPWQFQTPIDKTHPSHRWHDPHASSSGAGQFGSSVYYSTPNQPYPRYPDPAFSNSTLPPSSPPPSSSLASSIVRSSSPIRPPSRPPSAMRGRSKSRGPLDRRVSFKLDGVDRPVVPTAPGHSGDEDSDNRRGRSTLPRLHMSARETDPPKEKGRNKTIVQNETTAVVTPMKGKGKARAYDPLSDSEVETPPRVNRRYERGRTPGPPPPRSPSVRPYVGRSSEG